MELITKAPKGTVDLVPEKAAKWQAVEEVFRSEAELNGFGEIRTPVFEHTELFLRGVGTPPTWWKSRCNTFEDKGGRSITLRPEGTAGAVRAMLETGLYNAGYPVKLYYLTSCYRYEKPQAGACGSCISSAWRCSAPPSLWPTPRSSPWLCPPLSGWASTTWAAAEFHRLPHLPQGVPQGIEGYFTERRDQLCDTCLSGWSATPCAFWTARALSARRCARARPAFWTTCARNAKPTSRRCRTTSPPWGWNLRSTPAWSGAWTTTPAPCSSSPPEPGLCPGGRGRYDGLVEQFGGKPTPGLGFGLGLDRIMMALEAQKVEFPQPVKCELYIATMGEEAQKKLSC